MRIHFDENADALYIRFDTETDVIDSEEIEDGFIVDYDSRDQIVGIELLGVKKRIPLNSLKQVEFKVA
ncbi:MAG: DUF2283 domain-containing protein [Oligoflexia bacterium]|nr:DUF2283 domain-containing protein [Oligoflexia bacterium]